MHFRQGYLSLTHSFGVAPPAQYHEIWPQETRNGHLSCGKTVFRYLERFRRITSVTNGRTD